MKKMTLLFIKQIKSKYYAQLKPGLNCKRRFYAGFNLTKGYDNPTELINYIEQFGSIYTIINRDKVINHA